MGYVYENGTGRLCCDICGDAPASLKRCPYGYCKPLAVCKGCWVDDFKAGWKKAHDNCKALMAASVSKCEEYDKLIEDGWRVRVSAKQMEDDAQYVHVIFRHTDGDVGAYMRKTTYDEVPINKHATWEDYERHGLVVPAPNTFNWKGRL